MVPALVGTDNIQYTKYSQQTAKAIKMDALFLIQGVSSSVFMPIRIHQFQKKISCM